MQPTAMSHDAPRRDGELISAYAAGDPAAFDELVRRHGAMVLAVCQRVLGRSGEAEEVVQSVFLLLSRKAAALSSKGDLAGWLHRSAWYAATVVLRERRRRLAREKEAGNVASARMAQSGDQPNPLWETIAPRLDAALHALPEQQREALAACYLEGRKQEDVAVAMGVPRNVLAGYCRRGLEALRRKLGVRDAQLSAAMLATLLAAHAGTALPPALLTLSSAVATGTASGKVALLATATGKAMQWAKIKALATTIVLAGCLCGALTWGVMRFNFTGPPVTTAATPTFPVTPKGSAASIAFDALRRKGFSVAVMGQTPPLVPAPLRFTSVDGAELVDAVARYNRLKTFWSPDRKSAILFAGAADAALAQLRTDLQSTDVAIRRTAAQRAATLEDIHTIPLLVNAARDTDPEVKQSALLSLRALNWDAAVTLDAGAWAALQADADGNFQALSRSVGRCPADRALPLLERAVNSPDAKVRVTALQALALLGGEPAHALVAKTLADTDPQVHSQAILSLAFFNDERDVAQFEKVLANTQRESDKLRENAVCALGYMNNPAALRLIEQTCSDSSPQVRYAAASALGRMEDKRALELLEKLAVSPDYRLREGAAYSLGCLGGERALTLLKRLVTDPNIYVRNDAVFALGEIGGPQAEALLQTAQHDPEADIRTAADTALKSLQR